MNKRPAKWLWDDVRFFLAVAREGSLSAAARLLDVGHVTVARRITLLEKHLGAKLVTHTPDGFAITPAGQAILKQSKVMERAALDLERAAAGRDSLTSGTVRLTAAEALARRIVVPATADAATASSKPADYRLKEKLRAGLFSGQAPGTRKSAAG